MTGFWITLGGISAAVIAFFIGRFVGYKSGRADETLAQAASNAAFLRDSLRRLAKTNAQRDQDVAAAFHLQMELTARIRTIDEKTKAELARAPVEITTVDLDRWEAENLRARASIDGLVQDLAPKGGT